MIRNPIFRREFITSCRTVRIKILTLIYLLSLAFVLLIMWPGGGVLSAVSESGRQIFQLFFTVNLTVLILLVPAFSATSVTSERENDTFAALYTTLLTPTEIMSGKLFSSILMLLILDEKSLPDIISVGVSRVV